MSQACQTLRSWGNGGTHCTCSCGCIANSWYAAQSFYCRRGTSSCPALLRLGQSPTSIWQSKMVGLAADLEWDHFMPGSTALQIHSLFNIFNFQKKQIHTNPSYTFKSHVKHIRQSFPRHGARPSHSPGSRDPLLPPPKGVAFSVDGLSELVARLASR